MNTTLLVEAKREYTEQLVIFLRDAMHDEFYLLWKQSVDSADPMMNFQERLEEIVDWDEKTMIKNTDQCISKTGCNFLDDLITAVFVAHMKILISIKNTNSKDHYRLQVPTTNKFVYECMIQCSREFWKSPYLFYQNESENKIKKVQIQKNLRQAENIISDCVKHTIRAMLPVKEIVGDVFEYDKDGDLILDVKRNKPEEPLHVADTVEESKEVSSSVDEESETPILESVVAPDVDESLTVVEEIVSEPVSGNISVSEDTTTISEPSLTTTSDPAPAPAPAPTPTPAPEPIVSATPSEDRVEHDDEKVSPAPTPDREGGDDDLLVQTIENIRTSNSEKVSSDMREWEYTPDTSNATEEDTKTIDWDKGFVMGPVEDDMLIDAEPIGEPEVDLGDVVEIE